jgi:hypothetical protein
MVPNAEVGIECGQEESAARLQAARDAPQHGTIVGIIRVHPKSALADADRSVELFFKIEVDCVHDIKSCTQTSGVFSGNCNESFTYINTAHPTTTGSEFYCMSARATANIQH